MAWHPQTICDRLARAEATLAEAQAIHEYWLTCAEEARLVTRRGYVRVADGQGGFTEEPIPSSAQTDGS